MILQKNALSKLSQFEPIKIANLHVTAILEYLHSITDE